MKLRNFPIPKIKHKYDSSVVRYMLAILKVWGSILGQGRCFLIIFYEFTPLTLVPILVLILDLILVRYLFPDPFLFPQGPQFPVYSQNSGILFPFYYLWDLDFELYFHLFLLLYLYLFYLDVIFLCLHHLQLTLNIQSLLIHPLHLALHKLIYMDLIYSSPCSDYYQCPDYLFS